MYINLVAKAIFCILELKKNIHTIDKEAVSSLVLIVEFRFTVLVGGKE